jgi:hypothetical protein
MDDKARQIYEDALRKRHYLEQQQRRDGTLEQHPTTWESDCCNAKIITAGSKVVCLSCGEECS